jgi:microcompartment protein CcmK/EutM
MRIAKVVGSVTLNRAHPTFHGVVLRLAIPQTLAQIAGETSADVDTVVVWDDLGSGHGSMIGLSEGAEAAQPFRPQIKPVDAYAAALLDSINLDKALVQPLLDANKKK